MRAFYSWQSNLPNSTNRGLILASLIAAAKAITSDDSIDVEPVVDRDTEGVSGSPDIAATIFEKILKSDAFVADISIVHTADGRAFPNPNVLVELGFAVGVLGWERVILIANIAYGPLEVLPFDLKQRRITPYRCAQSDLSKAPARKGLAKTLEEALRHIAVLPQREREKLTAPYPDIRVKTTASEVFIAAENRVGVVSVDVQNHSPVPVFLTGICVALDNGNSLFLPRNELNGRSQGVGRLEPGQRNTGLIKPSDLTHAANGRRILHAFARDEIGRVFKGDDQELALALEYFRRGDDA